MILTKETYRNFMFNCFFFNSNSHRGNLRNTSCFQGDFQDMKTSLLLHMYKNAEFSNNNCLLELILCGIMSKVNVLLYYVIFKSCMLGVTALSPYISTDL